MNNENDELLDDMVRLAEREQQPLTCDTAIDAWHIEHTVLDDQSKVFNLVGASDRARVVINCDSKAVAIELQSLLLGRVVGFSATSTV